MKKYANSLIIAAMMLLMPAIFMSSCSETAPAPTPTGFQWPERMAVVSSTGIGEAVNIAWASPLEEDTGMKVRVVPEASLMLRFKWLKEGRFFMCGESTGVVGDVLAANREYAVRDLGPFPLRVIWSGGKTDSGYIVRSDSYLHDVNDIRPGTKMPEMSFSGTPRARFIALAVWAGVDEDDIVWVPFGNYEAMIRGVTEGRVDLAFAFPTSASVYEAEVTPHGIRWLELPYDTDPEGVQRFLDLQPYTQFGFMSQGAQSAHGVKSNSGVTLKYVTEDADPALVYYLAKWLDENHDRYKGGHNTLEDMTLDTLMQGLGTTFVPVHEGLIKYLKEKGLWTEAHDARQKANLELLNRYTKAYQAALAKADEREIKVDPLNNDWLTLWESFKTEFPPLRLFLGIEQ